MLNPGFAIVSADYEEYLADITIIKEQDKDAWKFLWLRITDRTYPLRLSSLQDANYIAEAAIKLGYSCKIVSERLPYEDYD